MAEFFFWLAITLQCGLFPMAWGDCEPSQVPVAPFTVQSSEVQAP